MTRRNYCSHERFDSFVAELVSSYCTTHEAPLPAPERQPWTDEELSRIRCELRKLTAIRVFNAPDAEDIVQETLLTLINNCPEKDLEKGPLVWSIGVLRNKIGNYYRKVHLRARHEEREAKLQHGLFKTVNMISPEGELIRGELRNVITGTIDSLPPEQKTAMKMLVAGLKPREIAAKMSDEPYQTVINHLHRGRKKLARELIRHGFDGMHEMKRGRGVKKRTRDEQVENKEIGLSSKAV